MKYAIIADIHGNLEALQAVLKDAKEQAVTHYACLGDVVGYGANPKECLDIVREMKIPTIKGNHDEYCSSGKDPEGFNEYAREAILWTRAQMTEDDLKWLKDLKYIRIMANFTLVHSTLDGPNHWGYIFDKLEAAASFPYQQTPLCFFGHTHVPLAFIRDTAVRGGTYSKFKIEAGRKYLINVGSVGQSRDGVAKATYLTYDINSGQIELRRLDYDMDTAMDKIRKAGLPERLATRLAEGH
ncbi:MAG: metallophosphoesterase family protein [Verrucomicrobia bacterium]|nr:metallophosphoesterase family protein [Verrucomicrobiota bacterium]MBQ7589261.1 metallophosphoesterase family protein [Verrucomicrobiota bacterium]MBR5605033.1 metallophosphoesterase family protein [Verrucomicrobiota bacterium]MBR5691867.1 metallophosphoesterase family protein [Verrucomicrobiota bacterium]MBR5737258.1 metallophosphoesterase family protein [Verrucomicrobiota bacterium]